MAKLCAWIKEDRPTYHPIVFAAKLHKKFVFIHPFCDGNGRLARLLMNASLIQDRYLPIIIPPVYRADYISYLEIAHENDAKFIEFIKECEIQSQKDIMRLFHIKLP